MLFCAGFGNCSTHFIRGDHLRMRIRFLVLVCFAFLLNRASFCSQPAQQPAPAKPQPAQTQPAQTHSSQTQPAEPEDPHRIVTHTRLVSIFAGMEVQLYKAIQRKDKNAINALLTDEFEVWTPNQSGDPIPSDDWLQSVTTGYDLKTFRITQMSARDFSTVIVVKFRLSQKAEASGKDQSGDYFVIDAWQKEGESWKLSDRYISKVPALPAAPVRPTGKQ
jgi:uncharacterized protein DUF4440